MKYWFSNLKTHVPCAFNIAMVWKFRRKSSIPKWNATYRTQVLWKLPLFILKTVLNATNRMHLISIKNSDKFKLESVIAFARLSVSVNKQKKRPRSEKTTQAAKIWASEKRRFFHFSTIRFPHYLEAWKRLSQWLSISQSIKDFISLRNLWIAKSFG